MVAVAFVANAWAVDPFTVRDIRVEGLQRVEPGTVFASLPFRVGDQYNDEKGSAAIRALFGLGLFKDVRLEVSGDVLVVIVEERPTVADVDFVGTKEFDKDALKKALREIGLTEGRPYDQGTGRPRRAGTQAPVHQQEPLRRRGRHHGHADRAQPRQPDVHGHRRRAGPHQGNPHRRQQGLQRVDAARACSTWTPAAGSAGTPSRTATRAPSSMPTWKRCARTTSAAAISNSASTPPRSRSRPTSRTSPSP